MTVPFEALLGQGYTLWSQKAECDLSINVWRERIESGEGPGKFAMYRSPGISPYIRTATVGAVRGQFELNGHDFIVVGSVVYDYIGTALNFTYTGLTDDGRNVQFAASPNTLMIYAAQKIFRLNSAVLAEVALPFLPLGIVSLKNYFFSIGSTPSEIYWSEDDGATFPASNVQNAEADSNGLVAIRVIHQQLWAIGNRITQIFSVGPNPNAPLVPTDAGPSVGTDSPQSVQTLGESLFWKAVTAEGQNFIVMTNGYGVEKISNNYIDSLLATLARNVDISDCIGMVYAFGVHQFYRLTFPLADRTIEFHRNANQGISEWEEVAWWDMLTGTYHRHRGNCIVAAFGRVLVGDHTNGIVYEMSPDIYHDFGFPIRYERRAPHIVENNHEISIERMELGIETGVGLDVPLWLNNYSMLRAAFVTALAAAVTATTVTAAQGLILQDIYDYVPYIPLDPYPAQAEMEALGFYAWGDDPTIEMEYSTNGGKSYSSTLIRRLGRSGDDVEVFWNNLSAGRDRVIRIHGTDPVKLALNQCWLELEEWTQ